ncbi:MAG: hypothetical protein H7245_15885, partial [Candidatus Saccharibacteria bacterium]|nr:hypothetical protein [Pseudorhodobacter sp.]
MSEVTFSDPPVDLTDARAAALPWNYLAPAFGDLLRRAAGQTRILMALPQGDQPARFAVIAGDILKDPKATADFILSLKVDGVPIATRQRFFVGPSTTRQPTLNANAEPEVFDLKGLAWSNDGPQVFNQAVVIIDAGIAFWNARFRGQEGPRFQGIRYFDFEAEIPGKALGLDAAMIADLCQMADTLGSPAVVDYLASAFPNSVFGPAANPDPNGFWHGTAVADLAGGAAVGEAENVALFGLELPREILADYSGETLSAMLAMILPAAIEMTAAFAGMRLTIVMPLGFPAGPPDGTHPAAVSIDEALKACGRADVQVIVPAGNHLQDRCHAQMDPAAGRTLIGWDLPPDDFSTNEIEIFGTAGEPLRLQVPAPARAAMDVSLPVSQSFRYILRDGESIGMLMRFADEGLRSRMRLALWHTASDSLTAVTPHGRWTLATDGPDKLELWLFRDDRDPMADRARPRRPSRFWSTGYQLRDASGAQPLTDDEHSAVLRSGTLSVLATPPNPLLVCAQAEQRLGHGAV